MLKKELGIFTYGDLLNFFPYRHIDKTRITRIADLTPSIDFAQVQGKLWYYEMAGERSGRRLTAFLTDETGVLELTWFKNVSWIEKNLKQNELYNVFGRISFFMGKPQIVHPEMELVKNLGTSTKDFLDPVYSTTVKL